MSDQKYRVTRMCCTSGQCIDCHSAGGRTRVVHADNVSKELAERMLVGWSAYKPVMAPVEPEDGAAQRTYADEVLRGEARGPHSGTSGSGEGY